MAGKSKRRLGKEKTMDVSVTSLKQLYADLRQARPDMPVVALICSSYPVWEEALGSLEYRLVLAFDDVDDARRQRAFSPEIAQAVTCFVRALPQGTRAIRVCCDGGRSRSAALAAAILRYQGESDMCIWRDPCYCPNPLVYCLQCEAFGVRVSGVSLRWRQWRNRRASNAAFAGKQARQR